MLLINQSELGCWEDFWEISTVRKTIKTANFEWQVLITHSPPLLFLYVPTKAQGFWQFFSISNILNSNILHFWEESEMLQDEISGLCKH